MKLFSKNSNLCDHNPPMSQTEGRTDDMRSQDRALHCSASRGKNRLVTCRPNEKDTYGRARVTTDEERVLHVD